MAEIRDLVCIVCPRGCRMKVTLGEEITVTGNSCPKGVEYGVKEVTNPTRSVTSTVKLVGGMQPVVAVKTKGDVPKGKIFEVMKAINEIVMQAPVHIGDIARENIAGTNVDLVVTMNVKSKQ